MQRRWSEAQQSVILESAAQFSVFNWLLAKPDKTHSSADLILFNFPQARKDEMKCTCA